MGKKVKTQEDVIDEITDFIETLPEEERAYFAKDVCFNAALYGGNTDIESVGIIESAKRELQVAYDKHFNEMIGEALDKEVEEGLKAELKKQGVIKD